MFKVNHVFFFNDVAGLDLCKDCLTLFDRDDFLVKVSSADTSISLFTILLFTSTSVLLS